MSGKATSYGLRVEEVLLADVHPAPWNVRTGHAVEAIAESMAVNGVRQPLHVWAYQAGKELPRPWCLVAGEGRYHAHQQRGDEIVVVVPHDFDSLQSAKRFSIADNRLTDRSRFDLAPLRAQLAELPELEGTGFDSLPPLRHGYDLGGEGEGTGSGGANDEGDEEPEAEEPARPEIPLALSIVLVTAEEKHEWLDWKGSLGVASDKAALMALLREVATKETEDG